MKTTEKIVCIIPSRYGSSRFEGKPLADLLGKPMIQHVYERVLQSPVVAYAAVATDDARIFAAVERFGGRAIMTSPRRRSGTDRIAEAVAGLDLTGADIVVNIQGDQPLFEPVQVEQVVAPLLADAEVPMSTLIYRIVREEEITHPNAVKVAVDARGFALYFSRATIPHVRDAGRKAAYYKHHGIYAYRRSFLDAFAALPDGTLEKLEALEQLRALEFGYRIRVAVTEFDSVEVDTPQELARVRDILLERQGGGTAAEAARRKT